MSHIYPTSKDGLCPVLRHYSWTWTKRRGSLRNYAQYRNIEYLFCCILEQQLYGLQGYEPRLIIRLNLLIFLIIANTCVRVYNGCVSQLTVLLFTILSLFDGLFISINYPTISSFVSDLFNFVILFVYHKKY